MVINHTIIKNTSQKTKTLSITVKIYLTIHTSLSGCLGCGMVV